MTTSGLHARLRRVLVLLLPLLLLAAEAAALPIKAKGRGTRSRGGVRSHSTRGRTLATVRGGDGNTSSGTHATSRRRSTSHTRGGGRLDAGGDTPTTYGNTGTAGGRLEAGDTSTASRRRSNSGSERRSNSGSTEPQRGGGNGTGNASSRDVHNGLFGLPGGRGARNGLDGTTVVLPTRRRAPPGVHVMPNHPGAYLSRGGAFRLARRKAGIPDTQAPRTVRKRPETDSTQPGQYQYEHIYDQTGRHVTGRTYRYDGPNGTTIEIQEHSYGHAKGGHGPHFNTRIYDRDGKALPLPRGADTHTYFAR